jgi:hypothetical protein
MKRITILAIAIIASVASLSAQQEEYKSISLHHKALNEIQSSLPTVINIVDGDEGEIISTGGASIRTSELNK